MKKLINDFFVVFILALILTIAFSFAANAQADFIIIPTEGGYIATDPDNEHFAIVLDRDGSSYATFKNVDETYMDGYSLISSNCSGFEVTMPNIDYAEYDHEKGNLYIDLSLNAEQTLEAIEGNMSMLYISRRDGSGRVKAGIPNISFCLWSLVKAACPDCEVKKPTCNLTKI